VTPAWIEQFLAFLQAKPLLVFLQISQHIILVFSLNILTLAGELGKDLTSVAASVLRKNMVRQLHRIDMLVTCFST
jgi:hypothetical protein